MLLSTRQGPSQPHPFSALGVSEKLVALLAREGFVTPFEVQSLAISRAVAGENLLVLARTGEGKTLTYGVSVLQRLANSTDPLRSGSAIIMVPSTQLARQVQSQLDPLAEGLGLRIAVASEAGAGPRTKGEVFVGTPEALLGAAYGGRFEPLDTRTVVLDEADILTMGQVADRTRRLIGMMRPQEERQTLLLSATLPLGMEGRVVEFLPGGGVVNASTERPLDRIHHVVYECAPYQRVPLLLHLLPRVGATGSVVFCAEGTGCDEVTRKLSESGLRAAALHGDLPEVTRVKNVQRFRDEELDVLVVSGEAARGLDAARVSHVFNLDLPPTIEQYLQQAGRTGRAGRAGTSISFVEPFLRWDFDSMMTILKVAPEAKGLPAEVGTMKPPSALTMATPAGMIAKLQTSLGYTFTRPALLLTAVDQNRRYCDLRETSRFLNLIGRQAYQLLLLEFVGTGAKDARSVEVVKRKLSEYRSPQRAEAASEELGLAAYVRDDPPRQSGRGERSSNREQALYNLLGALLIDSGSLDESRRVLRRAFGFPEGKAGNSASRRLNVSSAAAPTPVPVKVMFEHLLDRQFADPTWLDAALTLGRPVERGLGAVRNPSRVDLHIIGREVLNLYLSDTLRCAYLDAGPVRVFDSGVDSQPEFMSARVREERTRIATLDDYWETEPFAGFDRVVREAFGWDVMSDKQRAYSLFCGLVGALYSDADYPACAAVLERHFPDLQTRVKETQNSMINTLDPVKLQEMMDTEGDVVKRRLAAREANKAALPKTEKVLHLPARPACNHKAELEMFVLTHELGKLKIKALPIDVEGQKSFRISITIGKEERASIIHENQADGIDEACRIALEGLRS